MSRSIRALHERRQWRPKRQVLWTDGLLWWSIGPARPALNQVEGSLMALHFDLCVTTTPIGYFEAVRITNLGRRPEPDEVSTYRVRIDGDQYEVAHRHGDGAWELVRKALEARRPAEA